MDNKQFKGTGSKITEHTLWLLLLFNIVLLLGSAYLYNWLPMISMLSVVALTTLTVAISIFALLHAKLSRNAMVESLNDQQLLQQSELFDAPSEGEQSRTLRQFERYFVPGFTLILALSELFGAWYLYSQIKFISRSPLESPNFHLGLLLGFGVIAFFLFLVGKYAAGVGFGDNHKQLRAPSALTILQSFFLLFTLVAMLVAHMAIKGENSSWRNPDALLLYSGVVLFAIFALEHFFILVLSFYRPRTKEIDDIPQYESRLTTILAQPEGIFDGVEKIIDYQFGFKLSQTAFYSLIVK